MGTGRHLMVSATGFPATNETWRFIQQAWREPLEGLARLCGEKVILTGINVAMGSASNGYVSYGGEVLQFIGGPLNANVTIIEEITSAQYDVDIDNDGVQDTLPQYKRRYIQFGNGGVVTFPFSDLTRLDTIKALTDRTLPAGVVIDANYVHTDNNFTLELLQKLNGIEAGAEVNVRSDWNDDSPGSDAHILNRPFRSIKVTSGMMMATLLQGGNQSENPAVNRANVYPPTGYSISDLAGFINSLAYIDYSGDVDGNDSFWCKYQIDTPGNKVIMYGNASEHGSASRMNYFAIWIKKT